VGWREGGGVAPPPDRPGRLAIPPASLGLWVHHYAGTLWPARGPDPPPGPSPLLFRADIDETRGAAGSQTPPPPSPAFVRSHAPPHGPGDSHTWEPIGGTSSKKPGGRGPPPSSPRRRPPAGTDELLHGWHAAVECPLRAPGGPFSSLGPPRGRRSREGGGECRGAHLRTPHVHLDAARVEF